MTSKKQPAVFSCLLARYGELGLQSAHAEFFLILFLRMQVRGTDAFTAPCSFIEVCSLSFAYILSLRFAQWPLRKVWYSAAAACISCLLSFFSCTGDCSHFGASQPPVEPVGDATPPSLVSTTPSSPLDVSSADFKEACAKAGQYSAYQGYVTSHTILGWAVITLKCVISDCS